MNKNILKKSAIILFFFATALIPHLSAAQSNSQNNGQNMPTQSASMQKNLKNLTVICEKGCAKKPKTFLKAWKKLEAQLKSIESALKTPVKKEFKPLEVHIGFDATCGATAPGIVETNVAKGFTHYKPDGRAMICLNDTLKKVASGYTAFTHELGHLYFNTKRDTAELQKLEEKLVIIAASYVVIHKNPNLPKSVCAVAEPDKEFCSKYDLEYAKIPLFMKHLAEMRAKKGQLTEIDLADALKYVAGK